jgi:hypothetical protein
MPKKSKQTDPTPLNQLSAMTVDQFCAAHSISRSKFYEFNLLNAVGDAPLVELATREGAR